MGHLTYRLENSLFSEGTIASILSKDRPWNEAISQIASSLGVSQKNQFIFWDEQTNTTTIADPNDRVCNE